MTASGSTVKDPADAELLEAELRGLITRIGAGDQRAMEQFYRSVQARIYRFAGSRLNDSFAAADVLHETMIEIWKGANRFQARSQVMTWVLGIANHKTIDIMRKRYRNEGEELDEGLADTDLISPETAVDAVMDKRRLQACLTKLSEKHRAVLHLAFYEDMAYDEIAAVVGCPEGTVKTRVYHAKEALRRCLAQKTG